MNPAPSRNVLAVMPDIMAYLGGLGWPPYYNTGHSKGAAEAILFHAFMKEAGRPPVLTRAYEPPRVGSPVLRAWLADQDVKWTATRNLHGRDIVTMVPAGPRWAEVGSEIDLTVPDTLDIPTKHRIPAVIAALQSLAV